VTRPFRQQADEEILDHAAALFAQHGFAHTSLSAIAEAVGLSKAGLLHHYPSKEALYEAAQEACRARSRQVREQASGLVPGSARDRRLLELLTDVALDRPGLVALLFQAATAPEQRTALLEDDDLLVFEMFGADPRDPRAERLVRVIGALSALAVLSLAANHVGDKTAWRPLIIATCYDALGHSVAGPASNSDQVEA
jgi:AcrR family transcriptional regulator